MVGSEENYKFGLGAKGLRESRIVFKGIVNLLLSGTVQPMQDVRKCEKPCL